MNLCFHLLYSLWLFIFALPGICVPDFQKSQLPLPKNMDPGDERLLEEALKLEVYKDTEDPNLFHYVPPFHVRQYVEGAASMVLFTTKIQKYDRAEKLVRNRNQNEAVSLWPMQEE